MVAEDYCSVEIAKLLEEKGFPIWEYHKGAIGVFNGIAVSNIAKELIEEKMLSCIPHSVVMKWLREVHNIYIEICGGGHIYRNTVFKAAVYNDDFDCLYEPETFQYSYEEAIEEAIKYCLENLI